NGSNAIDHNSYVVGDYLYMSAYTSGMRVLDIHDPLAPVEVGWLDTHPEDDATVFQGAWAVYAGFASGHVIISDIERGLFVMDPAVAIGQASCGAASFGAGAGGANIGALSGIGSPKIGGNYTVSISGLGGVASALLLVSAGQLSLPLLGGTLLVNPSSPLL